MTGLPMLTRIATYARAYVIAFTSPAFRTSCGDALAVRRRRHRPFSRIRQMDGRTN